MESEPVENITYEKLKEVANLLTPKEKDISQITITSSTAIDKGRPILLMHPDDFDEYVKNKTGK
jgi:hypothetical protein